MDNIQNAYYILACSATGYGTLTFGHHGWISGDGLWDWQWRCGCQSLHVISSSTVKKHGKQVPERCLIARVVLKQLRRRETCPKLKFIQVWIDLRKSTVQSTPQHWIRVKLVLWGPCGERGVGGGVHVREVSRLLWMSIYSS